MKKHISVILTAVLAAVCLSACGKSGKTEDAGTSEMSVVATIFPPYDFTRQIAGDDADVIMLLSPGAESHSYEPTPQDIKTIQSCDLFIYTGGESDVWVEDILSSMGDQMPETLRLVDCVPTVTEEIVEGMEHWHEEHEDHGDLEDHEDHEEETDEHVWTSPQNAIKIVKNISSKLCEMDPDNAGSYEKNSAGYIEQPEMLDASFREVVGQAERRTILFGDRFPFRYFADEYGLDYYAAFPGCSDETEASAATVAFLINKVNEEQIPVIFTIERSNGKLADSICEATGAEKRILYSCHNVTGNQLDSGATYLSMMMENVESLRAALN